MCIVLKLADPQLTLRGQRDRLSLDGSTESLSMDPRAPRWNPFGRSCVDAVAVVVMSGLGIEAAVSTKKWMEKKKLRKIVGFMLGI